MNTFSTLQSVLISDPLRALWMLLTNVKFALALVFAAVFSGLLGVLIPQIPAEARENTVARAAWLELKHIDFGVWFEFLNALALFDVFHSAWFISLWFVVIVSVTVCTVSRFMPVWRSIHRPQKIVPDSYFEKASHRTHFSYTGEINVIEDNLKRLRYTVEQVEGNTDVPGAKYLFAQRFSWAQYGTFISHLALLMLLLGGLLTALAGDSRTLSLSEKRSAVPLFRDPGPGQIFVEMLDAVKGVDSDGHIIDFRSKFMVRRGDENILCEATVNDPCDAYGYRFHQAAFFDDLALFSIANPEGKLLFEDVLDFENQVALVPVISVIAQDGQVLFDEAVPQMATVESAEGMTALAELNLRNGSYTISWRLPSQDNSAENMKVTITSPDLRVTELFVGESLSSNLYEVTFKNPLLVPAINVLDMPGTSNEKVTVQLMKDRWGSDYLYIIGLRLDGEGLVLPIDKTWSSEDGFSFTFLERVEGSGIDVRRDPGDTFIWIAIVLGLLGLGITFYIPRRRLWVSFTGSQIFIAGIAPRSIRFEQELRKLGQAITGQSDTHSNELEND
tara:strand:- start:9827 stop:11509 length:1683 start_codon:yes stop_codon:yes gene_type:complete